MRVFKHVFVLLLMFSISACGDLAEVLDDGVVVDTPNTEDVEEVSLPNALALFESDFLTSCIEDDEDGLKVYFGFHEGIMYSAKISYEDDPTCSGEGKADPPEPDSEYELLTIKETPDDELFIQVLDGGKLLANGVVKFISEDEMYILFGLGEELEPGTTYQDMLGDKFISAFVSNPETTESEDEMTIIYKTSSSEMFD